MTPLIRTLFKGLLVVPLAISTPAASLGQFDGHGDIGSPKLAGSATYNAEAQEYAVSAAVFNMWVQRDEFHWMWKKLKGDFILQARVEFVGQGVDPHRKLGWIVRSSLDPDSAYADATVHGDGLTSLQFRRIKGGVTEQVRSTVSAPDFLQFERKGSSYIFSAARFGDPLVTCQTNLALGDDVYAGLFLCSHNSNVVERAHFRDVRLIRPASASFVPYRDYIGSHLEILDVTTGRRELIHSAAQPFEAPNWTTDGKWIAFLSFSKDVSPTDHPYYKQVTLRLMPVAGGTPKVIAYVYGGQGTINVPSWSTDSKRLAFVSNSIIH